jgi:hypothetical protein
MGQQINGSQIVVGTPTDANYGVSPDNINVPGVLVTDKLPDAIDKLIGILDKLAPGKSPLLSAKVLSLQNPGGSGYSALGFFPARHVAATTSTPGNIVWNGGYSATQSAVTASYYANIYVGNRPIVAVSDSTNAASGLATFSDGQSGTLYAYFDGSPVAYRTLNSTYYTTASASSSPDVGTWDINGTHSSAGCLTISFDGDPYQSAPNQGFWTSLKATMSSTQSLPYDGVEHTYQVVHSSTGQTTRFKFICDNGNATAPTSLNGSPYFTVSTQSSTRWVSGIPSLAVGDIVAASYSISNTISAGQYPLISRFYNQYYISQFRMTATTIVSNNDVDSNGIPKIGGTAAIPYAYQPTWNVNGLTVSVASNMYSTDAIFSFTTYNPLSTSLSNVLTTYTIANFGAAAGKKLYIDTVSDESLRVRSGDGQYPLFGSGQLQFGDSYNSYSSTSIFGGPSSFVSGEMMLQNSKFQYPSGDYGVNYPVTGPVYTSLNNTNNFLYGGFYYRWVTFNVGTITSASSFIINLIGSSGISATGTNPITSSMLIYVTIVNGGSQVVGWLDANAAYSSGIPSTNGDPCVDYANSTATSRKITLGATTRTGTVYVRIGFPSGSTKYLTNITKT